MDIRTFTKSQLLKFVNSSEYENLLNVPISKHRAISQCVLFVENSTIKVGWLSGFRTEDFASNNVAALLFTKLIRTWRSKLLITNIAPYLENAYQALGLFYPIVYKKGLRVYLKSDLTGILPPKRKVFTKVLPLLKVVDLVVNICHYPFIKRSVLNNLSEFKIVEIDSIDSAVAKFIDEFSTSQITQRATNEINWIINNMWVKQGDAIDNTPDYYFSSYSKQFYYKKYIVTDVNNNVKGFFIVLVRDEKISIPLLYLQGVEYSIVANFIMNFMIQNRLSILTVFNNELKQHFSKFSFPFVIKKQIIRPYFVSKELNMVDVSKFQDGDGDVIFT